MAPIRVGIIGLSSATENISKSPGDGWAASAHLPYLLQSPHYEVTALCNSTVKSAEAAIARHGLSSSTKAYGNPDDIANDPNVDLVVVSVCVDRHHRLIMPALKAGKAAFVEWPLASNLQQAEEMLAAAKQSGSKTIVGLQSRANPLVQKVKELVDTEVIGDLLSSDITFALGWPGDVIEAEYMADKKVGGNFLTIIFSHAADAALYALGGLDELSASLSTRRPNVKLLKADYSVEKHLVRDTPDHILVQGKLSNSSAPISIFARLGKAFPDAPKLVWHILGTKGEIRVTANMSLNITMGDEKLEVFNHETDTVEEIKVEHEKEVKDLNMFGTNIGALYELYAKGGTVEQGFVDFEQAVGMHRVIDAIEKSSESGKVEKVAK
ncbi:NAD(P)-binding protein [Ophiobolus disseminans]|uniref:NAD(P)-binding protein n=1 Tax=Ophiobolus disseminans TaxID=1469910 RepID=A0A6A6ZEA5_9PLEO|nr:NAD(P)-binding protein [Ophiobolus disseminans]